MTLEIQHDKSLARFNTFGLKARAEHVVAVRSDEEVMAALALAREKSWRVTLLGGGSNVVFEGDVAGLVILIAIPGILFDGSRVEAGAGEAWHQVVMCALEQGLSGIENLSLIPGCAGAAPIQNIGAYGAELSSVFHSLTAIDRDSLETVELSAADCRFGYRDSVFKRELRDRMAITRIRLALHRQFTPNLDYEALRRELEAEGGEISARTVSDAVCAIRRRRLPDPEVLGNAGSFFKNPLLPASQVATLRRDYPALPCWETTDGMKVSAAWLIEQSGLKGVSVGGAAVSGQHALVIVNRANARGEDVLALARQIEEGVLARFGIRLEMEPVVIQAP